MNRIRRNGNVLGLVAISALLNVFTACSSSSATPVGQWVKRASMHEDRSWIGVASVEGKIYAIGGMTGSEGRRLDLNEVYDPRTNTWTLRAPLPTARSSAATAAVGRVIYVIGGYMEDGVTARVEAYDIDTDRWTTDLPPMPTQRFDLTAVALDHVIYAMGGNDGGDLNTVEAFDTVAGKWTTLPALPTPRYALQSVVMDGLMYVLGGRSNHDPTDVVETFDPTTLTWTRKARMPEAMAGFGAEVADGILHVVKYDKHFAYNPRTGQWTSQLAPMPTSRHGLQLAYIDGLIYAIGGCSTGEGDLFDIARNEAFIIHLPDYFKSQ